MGLSGEPDGAALVKLGGAVFGIPWNTARDVMSVVFRVNVFQHKRGNPTGPDLTRETLDQLSSVMLGSQTSNLQAWCCGICCGG